MGLVIGIPKEQRANEYRVGMTPAGVSILAAQGHQCYVESKAGMGSGFTDVEFEQAGARIAYNTEEIYRRADLLLKVQRPTEREIEWVRDGQILLCMWMVGTVRAAVLEALQAKGVTAIAYELIEEDDGHLPVLYPLSQVGGHMLGQIAAQLLQNNHGGKGILLGGAASVPPADVVIIGAGTVGMAAAESFVGMGARVILLDRNMRRLQAAHERLGNRITTMVSHGFNLRRVCAFADVLVGAVQVPGQRAPVIVTREMVRSMRPGSLIIDMSIDQGGCVETSRPTRHDQPTFIAENVIHYCVPNVPGVVARTATHAFLNAAWPFIMLLAEHGLDAALAERPALQRGLILRDGQRVTG
ncbi:MAG: alanine dehydrogenase [Anaerolineae bacterium]|nr:alanine dehydrogenase [Anaerolineae bacterium]